MSALTFRLPDDKYERLNELSRQRKIGINRLLDEMTTLMLAEFDAETRFQLRAIRGHGQEARGLALLANRPESQSANDAQGQTSTRA
jgi:predicted DNA-binding protein